MDYEKSVEQICSTIEKVEQKPKYIGLTLGVLSLSDDVRDQEILAELLYDKTKNARNFTLEGPFDPLYCILTDYEKTLNNEIRPNWRKDIKVKPLLKTKIEDPYYQLLGVLLRTDIKICDGKIGLMEAFYQSEGFQKKEEIQLYYDFLLRRDLLSVTLEEVMDRDQEVLSKRYDWKRDLVNINNQASLDLALEQFKNQLPSSCIMKGKK